jgi:predicted enzyme related to lactoylglutathione lyase
MANTTFGSILLGTTDPDGLKAWYKARFAPDHEGDRPLDLGGFLLVIDGRDDIADKNPEPARVILNFHFDDAHAEAARLSQIGVTWLVELEKREPGWFGTLVDPDGNYVQLIQLTNH